MLAVVAMVGATSRSMSAQIRWGNPETPRDGVCFYEDADFRGRWFCARTGDDLSEMPRGMNDRISSIRIFGRTEVEVFKDIRYRGTSARFATDVRNLQREGWNVKGEIGWCASMWRQRRDDSGRDRAAASWSASTRAWWRLIRPAGIDRSPSHRRASISAFSRPVTSQRMRRDRLSMG